MLDKHQVWLILGFRFLYGLRTITPFIIGASRISPLRFLILNILGASIWAIVIGVIGYLFGHTIELFIGDIKKYALLVFFILAGAGVIIWIIHMNKKPTAIEPTRSTTKSSKTE